MDSFYKHVSVFRAESALYDDRETSFASVSFVAKQIGINVTPELRAEWHLLKQLPKEGAKRFLINMDFDQMWSMISNYESPTKGTEYFPNLRVLVNRVRTIAHSNAEAERVFSVVTDVKTKKLNEMGKQLLNAICVIKGALKAYNLKSSTMLVTESHYQKNDIQ